MKKLFLSITFIFLACGVIFAPDANAVFRLAVTGAGQTDMIRDFPVSWGLSLRTHGELMTNSTSFGHGFMFEVNMPGFNVTTTELKLGYGFRSGKDFFFVSGAFVRWGMVPGPGLSALIGFGFNLVSDINILIPFSYTTGGLGGLSYAPYIEFVF